MSKVFGQYGPAFPRLGKLAFMIARPGVKAWFAANGMHTVDSRYAQRLLAGMREKLSRGETVYLIGICPSGHNSGIALIDSGFPSYQPYEALDAVVLPDNSFVAVGIMGLLPDITNLDFGIFKFTANGALDTSFGNGGGQIVPFDLGGSMQDLAVKVLQDSQGRYLVVGFSGDAISFTTTMVRLRADGSFDPSFGVGGKLSVASAPPPNADQGDTGTSIAFTPDGNILVGSIATNSDSPSGSYIGLAKLAGDTLFENGFESD